MRNGSAHRESINTFYSTNCPRGSPPIIHPISLVIGTGPLVPTSTPGVCRTNIDTLNAFTGGIDSSNVGGNFGRELRFAGINNIVIKGRADELVYLCIEDKRVDSMGFEESKNFMP